MRATLAGFLMIATLGSVMAGSPSTLAEQLLGHYYLIQKSLASDTVSGVSAAAAQIAQISNKAAEAEPQAKSQLMTLSKASAKLQASDLKSARNGFGELSDSLVAYLQATGAKRNPPYQFYCPMVKKNWLQPDKGIRNPYYGSSMLTCGELVKTAQVPQSSNENHR